MAENTGVPVAADGAAPPREDGARLVADWERFLTRAVDGAEGFARQRPLAAILLAFVAGFVVNALLSALFRRR